MNHVQPPFGMDREITQVRTHEYSTAKGNTIEYTYPYHPPYGRPTCFKKTAHPCSACPWRPDCANAEGGGK